MAAETVTKEDFNQKVLDEKNKVVLVDFWAEWCGPCRMLGPVIDSLSEKHQDVLATYKLNTDKDPDIAQQYQISTIPCCILFKDGKEIHRMIGHKPEAAFDEELQQHL